VRGSWIPSRSAVQLHTMLAAAPPGMLRTDWALTGAAWLLCPGALVPAGREVRCMDRAAAMAGMQPQHWHPHMSLGCDSMLPRVAQACPWLTPGGAVGGISKGQTDRARPGTFEPGATQLGLALART
jgi:hypothetical protein